MPKTVKTAGQLVPGEEFIISSVDFRDGPGDYKLENFSVANGIAKCWVRVLHDTGKGQRQRMHFPEHMKVAVFN